MQFRCDSWLPRTTGFTVVSLLAVSGCATARTTSTLTNAIPVFSQDSVTRDSTGRKLGALAGVVLDSASGAAIAGAQIVVRSQSTPQSRFAYTSERGGFLVSSFAVSIDDLRQTVFSQRSTYMKRRN